MPMYEFHCDQCDATFDHMATMDKRDHAVACPSCASKKTGRKLSVVAVGAAGGEKPGAAQGGGHVHSGMCGCGRVPGTCGMN